MIGHHPPPIVVGSLFRLVTGLPERSAYASLSLRRVWLLMSPPFHIADATLKKKRQIEVNPSFIPNYEFLMHNSSRSVKIK